MEALMYDGLLLVVGGVACVVVGSKGRKLWLNVVVGPPLAWVVLTCAGLLFSQVSNNHAVTQPFVVIYPVVFVALMEVARLSEPIDVTGTVRGWVVARRAGSGYRAQAKRTMRRYKAELA
jgi:hypothetical protein